MNCSLQSPIDLMILATLWLHLDHSHGFLTVDWGSFDLLMCGNTESLSPCSDCPTSHMQFSCNLRMGFVWHFNHLNNQLFVSLQAAWQNTGFEQRWDHVFCRRIVFFDQPDNSYFGEALTSQRIGRMIAHVQPSLFCNLGWTRRTWDICVIKCQITRAYVANTWGGKNTHSNHILKLLRRKLTELAEGIDAVNPIDQTHDIRCDLLLESLWHHFWSREFQPLHHEFSNILW